MTAYVLIVILLTSANLSVVRDVKFQAFDNEATCEAARTIIEAAALPHAIEAACVPK